VSGVECTTRNCLLGENCGNRLITVSARRNTKLVAVQHVGLKGNGIVAQKAIEADTCICEYKGDFVSLEELSKRIKEPHSHYYLMQVMTSSVFALCLL